MFSFAVNHMSVAKASYQSLLDTASEAGCIGIEVRNDLDGKLFDGVDPKEAGQMARDKGLRILALAEVKAFNRIKSHGTQTQAVQTQAVQTIEELASIASASGAEGISLIPANDGETLDSERRYAQLMQAVSEINPVLEAHDLTGFIEPLGFESASLRHKHEVVEVINELEVAERFKIVHDTFHHFLAAHLSPSPTLSTPLSDPNDSIRADASDNDSFFAAHTGMVHISGLTLQSIAVNQMADGHRLLVDAGDRLQNIEQLNALAKAGYTGPVSIEAFSPLVHQYTDPAAKLKACFQFIEAQSSAVAA